MVLSILLYKGTRTRSTLRTRHEPSDSQFLRGTEPRLDSPKNRADDGTRTRDPHLGKVMLYQLSHIRDKPEKSNPSILHISERGLQILDTPEWPNRENTGIGT